MPANEALSASLEDYLEAIFHIVDQKQAARAKDISKRMKVNSSSVTGALHALAEKSLINYAPYDIVTLTSKGKRVARDIVKRHETLSEFFVKVLAVPIEAAEEAACKMEHAVPAAIMERFIEFLHFVETCPRGGKKWVKGFGHYCDESVTLADCRACIGRCLEEVARREAAGEEEPARCDMRR